MFQKPFVGLIPQLPEVTPQQKEEKNPLTPYYKYVVWNTAGGFTTIDNQPKKYFYIHHIYVSIWSFGTLYNVDILDKANGYIYLPFVNIGDASRIDVDYSQPLKFDEQIRVYENGAGAGDVISCMVVGFVQNKE